MTDYATPFLQALGATATPQMKAAVTAWQTQESGPHVTGNNPWNLHVGAPCSSSAREGVKGYPHSQPLHSSTIAGLIGNRYAGPGDRNVAIFDTPAHGSAAAARNLLGPSAKTYGYDKVVAQARSGDPIGFLNALAASSWSAGRYGTRAGGPNKLLAVYRRLAPAPIPKEVPVADLRSANAVVTNAGYLLNEVQSGDEAGQQAKAAKVIQYASRFLAPAEPEPLSLDWGVAIQQILVACGHPTTFNEDGSSVAIAPTAILADATPEQVRELALLGYFGVGPGRTPGVDYSLRDEYYRNDGTYAINPDVDAWADYLSKKG